MAFVKTVTENVVKKFSVEARENAPRQTKTLNLTYYVQGTWLGPHLGESNWTLCIRQKPQNVTCKLRDYVYEYSMILFL